MSQICQLTGSTMSFGNAVSYSKRKTRRTWKPNVHQHRIWVPSEKRWVRLTLSTRALKTVDKNGIDAVLKEIRARGHKV